MFLAKTFETLKHSNDKPDPTSHRHRNIVRQISLGCKTSCLWCNRWTMRSQLKPRIDRLSLRWLRFQLGEKFWFLIKDIKRNNLLMWFVNTFRGQGDGSIFLLRGVNFWGFGKLDNFFLIGLALRDPIKSVQGFHLGSLQCIFTEWLDSQGSPGKSLRMPWMLFWDLYTILYFIDWLGTLGSLEKC